MRLSVDRPGRCVLLAGRFRGFQGPGNPSRGYCQTVLGRLLKKVVGSKNERELARLAPLVEEINRLEPGIQAASDEELKKLSSELRGRARAASERIEADLAGLREEDEAAFGQEHFKQLDAAMSELLPEAFALVREVARRLLGERHFDVQLIGGMVLHQGKIAEMKTGEGKTLAATLPVYLNALAGRGVHVVTVNDYLAQRDARWMGEIYRFLGLKVGVIVHGLDDDERKEAYAADVTYGTNNEFGFDYLRDNMKFSADDLVQREPYYAIVDEVDSILIDEARTPLIISGPAEDSTGLYLRLNQVIPRLRREGDYAIDEKARTVVLTEDGVQRAETSLGVANLYEPRNIELLHHLNQALRAHTLFKRDVDYIVKDGKVIIVDEFTGRLMPGRRYSEGLHQALEAKEGVRVESENQTLATITFQNYFRMYRKLAGMTGTADTEAPEFHKIYNLEVVVIPTHKPMIRVDNSDVVYRSEREKFEAAVEEIRALHQRGQPVLVGTVSIEKSERVSRMLAKYGIKHSVLNAKNHEKEAEIVAQAGQLAAVTISTNMAGRGTDIKLGQGVVEVGGLHILGTERHESRRIDNQLRGRSGRQGDPGSSRFYLSLEDDLLRIFGSDRISGIMGRLGMQDGEPIEHNLVSKAIENAQKKVEAHNFDIRKHLLEYDDVMNQQREVIYRQRREVLTSASLRPVVEEMIVDVAESLVGGHVDPERPPEEWDLTGLQERLAVQLGLKLDGDVGSSGPEALEEAIRERALEAYQAKEEAFTEPVMRYLEKIILLQALDTFWKDHLLGMDGLKEGIGLRGYGQRDPLQEYKREGYDMFMAMVERIKEESVSNLFRVQLARKADSEQEPEQAAAHYAPRQQRMSFSHGEGEQPQTVKRKGKKVGRNDPCPCGSGKKYKKCCGK
jgi:preprotein translocase subunit SecA